MYNEAVEYLYYNRFTQETNIRLWTGLPHSTCLEQRMRSWCLAVLHLSRYFTLVYIKCFFSRQWVILISSPQWIQYLDMVSYALILQLKNKKPMGGGVIEYFSWMTHIIPNKNSLYTAGPHIINSTTCTK